MATQDHKEKYLKYYRQQMKVYRKFGKRKEDIPVTFGTWLKGRVKAEAYGKYGIKRKKND